MQCFIPRKVPVSVTAITRFQLSSEISCRGASSATPALFTMMSSRPKRSTASAIVRSTAAGSAASILIGTACPPLAVTLPATAPARVPLMSATTTAAPSATSRRTVAAPIPAPPAVTIATRPDNFSGGPDMAPTPPHVRSAPAKPWHFSAFSSSKEKREVLREQHALVEDDLAPRDPPLTVHAPQAVLALADEKIRFGLDAVAIEQEAALDG